MDEQISIRSANQNDAALIADISRQTFYDTFASQNTPENMQLFLDTRFSRETLMLEFSNPANLFFIAYKGEEVAGYLKLQDKDKPMLLQDFAAMEIVRIYAVNSMIGKGVGKLLMQMSIDTAIRRNNTLLWLGVWQENKRAIEFYKNWGFEIFGEHKFILGNDVQTDWLMKKQL